MSFDIYPPIEYSKQKIAPSAAKECHTAAPYTLNDGMPQTPYPTDNNKSNACCNQYYCSFLAVVVAATNYCAGKASHCYCTAEGEAAPNPGIVVPIGKLPGAILGKIAAVAHTSKNCLIYYGGEITIATPVAKKQHRNGIHYKQ